MNKCFIFPTVTSLIISIAGILNATAADSSNSIYFQSPQRFPQGKRKNITT